MNDKRFYVVCDYHYDGYGFRGPFTRERAQAVLDADSTAVAIMTLESGKVDGSSVLED